MTRSQILHSYRLSSLARDTLCNRPWASPPVKGSLSPPGSRISLTLIIVIIAHVPVVVVVPWPPPGRSITAMNHPGRKNKNDKREELLERIPFFALFNNLIVFSPLSFRRSFERCMAAAATNLLLFRFPLVSFPPRAMPFSLYFISDAHLHHFPDRGKENLVHALFLAPERENRLNRFLRF